MRKYKIEFTVVPAWTYEGKAPSVYTFFESVALADLEGKQFRLDRSMQMRLIGAYVFGKQTLIVRDGKITVSRKVCFGTDFDNTIVDMATLKAAVADGKTISPGRYGPKFQMAVN